MKIASLLTVISCVIATPAFAGSEPYFVIAFPGPKITAVSLVKDADYVSMSLTIQSNQKKPSVRFAEIKEAQNLILDKAKAQPGIIVHKGPISLSPEPRSGISSYSSYSYPPTSTAQFHILAKLDKKTDVYACATRIRRFLDSVKMPGKSYHSLGQIQLTIKNPEQYRRDILMRISKDVDFVKSIMQTTGKISITGLEHPVLVRQVDDRKVELFINYSMTMELSNQDKNRDK